MSGTLAVEINRDGPGSIDAPGSFETDGPFRVRFRNHGEPAHVYLNLDDPLGAVADVAATNHYLDAGETLDVEVGVAPDVGSPVEGSLRLVTRYGATERRVTVTVDPADEPDVAVDPELATPRSDPDSGGPSAVGLLAPVALGGAGLVVVTVAVLRAVPLVGAVGVALLLIAGAYATVALRR